MPDDPTLEESEAGPRHAALRVVRGAGAIVLDDTGRLLVVQRLRPPGAGLWSLPGGKCEPGEDSRAAAVRECREETGLDVVAEGLAGSVAIDYPEAGVVFEVDDFRCRLVGGALQAGDDAGQVRWVDAAELAALPTSPGLREVLQTWGVLVAVEPS